MANKLQHMPEAIPYTALEEITNNFSDERLLGKGGFGKVYKGIYNGEEIAVKKLMLKLDDHANEKQLENELLMLLHVQHQNIVKLVGYCYQTKHQVTEHKGRLLLADVLERLLCFEYFPRGSLDKYLSDESCGLDWYKRYRIIVGICEGLNFLHNGTERKVFHLDLKPANILLDENWMPKICDFGLSKLISDSTKSHNTEHRIGSHPFMPREYIDQGRISDKYDVFSLGVTIIQIIAGPDGHIKYEDMSCHEFIELINLNWRGRIEGTSKHVEEYCQQVKKCITIALDCMAHDKDKRPTIKLIMATLKELDTTTHTTVEEEKEGEEHEQLEQIETTINSTVEAENSQVLTYGPWGGNGGTPHDIGAASSYRLKSVTIRYGDIIDSLTFSYSDHNEHVHSVGPWGGTGGANKYTIKFEPSEFLIEISGKFGPYALSTSNVITSLLLVTNEDRYGPFGFVQGTPFCTNLESNWAIVGFFARAERYVHKIGVYARPNSLDGGSVVQSELEGGQE